MKKLIVIAAGLVSFASWQTEAETKIDFTKQVLPILDKNCFKCHGPDKQKGKMRLDSRDAAMKGGKDGVVIVPGKADQSELYRRIILPKGNDDIMPNEGDPLTKNETDLIRDWINEGAAWPEGAVVVTKESEPTDPLAGLPAAFKPDADEAKAVAKLAQSGVEVVPIAMNVPWTRANFRLQGSKVTDTEVAPLKDIRSVTELNLTGTKVTDAGLAAIEGLSNLTRLHLELTDISDAGLDHLKNLGHLSYLNLYGTSVTDAGLEALKALKNLHHLYLWQTKVTPAGVKNLHDALPKLDISTGTELKPMAANQEPGKKEESKADKK